MKNVTVYFALLWTNLALAQPSLQGKTYTWYQNGLCSDVYSFITGDIYRFNHGCESSGYTHYGNYRLKKDTVFLSSSVAHEQAKLIRTDTFYTEGNTITLRFRDEQGHNISKDFVARFYAADDREYGLAYDSVQKALVSWKMPHLKLRLITLEKLGISVPAFHVEAPGAMTLEYTVQIPELVTRLGLLNQNIHTTGTETIFLKRRDGLVPADLRPYLNQEVIFKQYP